MDSIGFPIGFPELGVSVSPLIFHCQSTASPRLKQVWLPCPNLSYGKGLARFRPWMGQIFGSLNHLNR